jgi:hypothetical protein
MVLNCGQPEGECPATVLVMTLADYSPEYSSCCLASAAGTSIPYLPSLSQTAGSGGAEPKGNASRSCWTTQRLSTWVKNALSVEVRRRASASVLLRERKTTVFLLTRL